MGRTSDLPSALIARRQVLAGGLGIGGAVALSGFLAACTDDSANTTDGSSGKPRPGGRLRIGVTDTVPPTYLNGHSGGAQGASYQAFAWPLFHGSQSDADEPEPGLAEGYEVSEDGLVHTFVLRSGMTFHDGSPITAEAVAECLRSQCFADHPLRDDGSYNFNYAGFGNPSIVESIVVVDESRFEFHVSVARSDIRPALTQHYIYNSALMGGTDYGTDVAVLRDIGSGPFRVTDFQPGAYVELERYEGFIDEVLLDALRFENFEDSAAMALALRSGEIAAAFAVRKADHEALAADPEFEAVVYEPSFNIFFNLYPPTTPELQDPQVREAIALAMNRPQYREAFFSAGTAEPSAQGILHPQRRGYNPGLEEIPYDPGRAQELLDAAGVENMSLSFIGYPSGSHVPEAGSLLEAIKDDLEAVGISVALDIPDYATYLAGRYETDGWPIAYAPESSAFCMTLIFTPPASVGDEWPAEDPRSDPELMARAQEGLDAVEPERQGEIFEEVQRILHQEVFLLIPIAQVKSSMIVRRGVHEVEMSTLGPDYEDAWIEGS